LSGRDEFGFETAGYSPTDTAITVGAARRVGAFSVGVGVKHVQSKIVDAASTVAGDVGILWRDRVGKKLSAAFTATNLGGTITYGQEAENLPSAYRVGVGYRPAKRWALGLDVVAPTDGDVTEAAGAEWIARKTATSALSLRAGYNSRATGDVDGLIGPSFGMGFGFQGLSVDYAFLPMGDLGRTHRVSLSYEF
jgi:hypothetical protein